MSCFYFLLQRENRHSMFKELTHIVDFNPAEYLKIRYKINLRKLGENAGVPQGRENIIIYELIYGNIIKLSSVISEPYYFLGRSEDEIYTLVMIDSTLPNNRFISVLHWLKYNISENNHDGETKSSYIAPNPKINKYGQQYTFLLYKQKGIQNCLIRDIFQSNDLKYRGNFNLKEFEQNNKLELVGVNFFYCQRDRDRNSNKRKNNLDLILLDPKFASSKQAILKDY